MAICRGAAWLARRRQAGGVMKPLSSNIPNLSDLIVAVAGHHPFDELETEHKNAFLAWLNAASSPLDRYGYDPGHGVASGFVISRESQRFALVAHEKLKRWLQPGGHAQMGETSPAEVALREAREELGVLLAESTSTSRIFDLDVQLIPPSDKEPEHMHFDFRYLFVMPATELLVAGSDVADARWFSAGEAEGLPLDQGILRMIDKCKKAGFLE